MAEQLQPSPHLGCVRRMQPRDWHCGEQGGAFLRQTINLRPTVFSTPDERPFPTVQPPRLARTASVPPQRSRTRQNTCTRGHSRGRSYLGRRPRERCPTQQRPTGAKPTCDAMPTAFEGCPKKRVALVVDRPETPSAQSTGCEQRHALPFPCKFPPVPSLPACSVLKCVQWMLHNGRQTRTPCSVCAE